MNYSIYDRATGRVLRHLTCDAEQLACNLRDNEAAFPATLDPLCQRVIHAESGCHAVDCEPEPPSPLAVAIDRMAAIKSRMEQLDAKKARPIGALLLDPGNEEERAYLAALEQQLVALRQELNQLQTG